MCSQQIEERRMPQPKNEDNKKHGDVLQPLVDRAKRGVSPGPRGEGGTDPAELQDDDDEDVQNDDTEDNRDVGERH
jgi:hypothetical protein